MANRFLDKGTIWKALNEPSWNAVDPDEIYNEPDCEFDEVEQLSERLGITQRQAKTLLSKRN